MRLSSTRITEFSATVNGAVETNQVLVAAAPLDANLETLTKEWKEADWKPLARNFNIVNAFLNTPRTYRPYLDRVVQLRLFQNKDRLRLLGLLNDASGHQTYQWIAEIPKKILDPQDPASVDFALTPPAGASDIINVKMEKMEVCVWSMPRARDFQTVYLSQGFSGKTWSDRNEGSVYVLQKGTVKLMAVVKKNAGQSRISLVKLPTHP